MRQVTNPFRDFHRADMLKRLGILLIICAAAFLAVSAYCLLFTTFMAYDDEGYILISLKNYSEQGGLYAHVYSQYGPFFYLLHDIGHRLLHYDFTNTVGRLITLLCWLTTAGTCALVVWQQTRSLVATGFTLTLTFYFLSLMVREPIHPGGVIAVLVAVAAAFGSLLVARRSMPGLAIVSGAIGAALLLIKINVGVLFLVAATAWFATNLHKPIQAWVATIVMAVLLVLLPLALMFVELREEWCRTFVFLSAVASVTMLSVSWQERRPLTNWTHAWIGAGAIFSFAAIVIGAVCFRGTNLSEMVDGILLGPLRHPTVYHFAPDWKPDVRIIGTGSILLLGLVASGGIRRLCWLLFSLRLVIIVGVCLASSQWLPFTSHSSVMSYAIPLAWIFALRLGSHIQPAGSNAAPWIGLILVLQYLHAYPVAGTQIAWGTFLTFPLMAIGLHDSCVFLKERNHNFMAPLIGIAALTLATISAGKIGLTGWRDYEASEPLSLSGAENVRPPEALASALRTLVLNADAHGDMLYSFPGMFSFNGWTGLPTPTSNNTTHWFSLLDANEQEKIQEVLARDKRPVVIVNRGLLDFLKEKNFTVSGPLRNYLVENFKPVFKLRDYEFCVRRDRTVVPLGVATLLRLKFSQPDLVENKIEMAVALPRGSRITRIELVSLESNPIILSYWDKTRGQLSGTGINLSGAVVFPASGSAWDRPLPPIVRLELPLVGSPTVDQQNSILYLRNATGEILAEARFTD